MISLTYHGDGILEGASKADLESRFQNFDRIRQIERASIREFMERQRPYLKGRVLDYGAGKPGTCHQPQPYRDLVDGEYIPFDIGDVLPASIGSFDAVICTQVLQYLVSPIGAIFQMHEFLVTGGHLIMTTACNWDEVETADYWRFTKAGIDLLLRHLKWESLLIERRAEVVINKFKFPLGYGIVAKRN